MDGITYMFHNNFGTLVRHGALIEGRAIDRRGVNAGHFFLELVEIKFTFRLATGQYPAGTVRSRIVPVRIAFSGTE